MQTQITTTPAPISLDSYIVSTPGTLGGRPRIANTRIGVIHVATWRLKMGMSPELIAGKWQLSLSAVYAALAYYYDHRAEIDKREAEDMALAEQMRAAAPPSILQERLKELREAQRGA